MIALFSEIYTDVLTQMGHTIDTVESTILDAIKLRINMIQDSVEMGHNYEWRKERFYFNTRPPLTAGTVSVTQGSKTVTGSGTAFTDIVKTGFLIIDGYRYRIDPHTSVTTTSLSLLASYPKTTNSTAVYKIVFPLYILDPEISAIVNILLESEELDVKNSNRITLYDTTTGKPTEAALVGTTDFTFHSSGTVTVTNGSTTVTGIGTSFTSEMEGMPFRVDENSEPYTVHSVASTTSLTLRQEYQGDSGSGKSYKIAPRGSLMLELRSTPDDYYFMEIEALTIPRKLVSANNVARMPNHAPLLHGAMWMMLAMEKKEITRIRDAKESYLQSIRDLKEASKMVKVKWKSSGEVHARASGTIRFDPLSEGR